VQEPACPVCGEVSRSRHSIYSRRLQDFPWQGVAVELWATVSLWVVKTKSAVKQDIM
jgi:transposase